MLLPSAKNKYPVPSLHHVNLRPRKQGVNLKPTLKVNTYPGVFSTQTRTPLITVGPEMVD